MNYASLSRDELIKSALNAIQDLDLFLNVQQTIRLKSKLITFSLSCLDHLTISEKLLWR